MNVKIQFPSSTMAWPILVHITQFFSYTILLTISLPYSGSQNTTIELPALPVIPLL